MNWNCLCGNFVRDKRFCPRCKLVRFRLDNSPILDYWGMRIGSLSNGLPFNFPLDLLSNHLLVTGQTGTGKTRLAMNLAIKAENHTGPHTVNLLIIDVEGEWKNIIPKMKKPTQYFAVEKNLRINPFDLGDPALIRELMRETVFKGIEKEYIDLSAQMNFVLQETINESRNMEELIKNIKSYDRQKLTALDKTKTALLVRLDPFMRSPLKEIFFCKKSNPDFSKLDENNVIVDLHALDALVAYGSELRLIYNTITTYFLRKMLNRGTCNWVSNLFVADEAQLLVPRILHKIVVTESWPATEFATRLRKRGCGLVLITQSPSNIEKDIIKNTATKISFRLQHHEDIKLIAESVGFNDPAEYQYLADSFVKLEKKTAIVSTVGHDPFLILSDKFEFAPHIPDVESILDEVKDKSESDADMTFLESIVNKPYLSVTERRAELGWNDRKYSNIVDGLLRKRKIERLSIKIGRGSPKILYQKPGTNPSVRHQYYVNWLAEKLRAKGFVVKKNKDGPDIVLPETSTAIEVELGTSNMHYNIARNVKKFSNVIVCSDQKKLLEDLSAQTEAQNVFFLPVQNVPAFVEKMQTGNGLKNR